MRKSNLEMTFAFFELFFITHSIQYIRIKQCNAGVCILLYKIMVGTEQTTID